MNAPDKERRWQVAPPDGWRTSYRRRAMAQWITDAQQGAGQLLARVIVNRLWQHHFGRGIVVTPNDFGAQGRRPTHPELLDWLSDELIRGGWRLKDIQRLIMTSAVYRRSAEWNEANATVDPSNELCWRFAPRRLEAEAVRDAMLNVSGLLERRMYGPGTLDERQTRRSIYFTVKRSRLIPTMQLLDAPEALVSIAERGSTTIAPQALLFMNNDQVRRCAAELAKRLGVTAESKPAESVRRAYLLALSRAPTAQELDETVAFIQQQTASYSADNNPNARELALTDFCQVLLGLSEFIYVD
jgi:hypothetical protein